VADLRVSDQDREAVALQLREHFAAGRLTQDELNERIQGAYSARTQQQLDSLLSDLPALPATRQQLRAELVERRRHLQRRLIQESGGGLAIFAVCVAIWAANGSHDGFWPGWVAIFVVLPLIRNGWRLYGPDPQLDRVERELDRRARHEGRRQRRR
jgi:thioesterase domain-containing protein